MTTFPAMERLIAAYNNLYGRSFKAESELLKLARAELQKMEELLEAVKWIAKAGERENTLLRKHGFVFNTELGKPDAERTPAEMWEKLAFSIHTDIWEIANRAQAAICACTE